MRELMKQAITEASGKISTKRIIVFLLVLLLIVVIIGHVFFNKTIAEFVFNGLIEAVIWSMGFIGSEKFVDALPSFANSRRGTTTSQPRTNTPLPSDNPEENQI